jgi:hypothetical protein
LGHLLPEEVAYYRQELLDMQVCIIAPQTSYDINIENLYDFDLPPGLVTLRVAKTVINLYRRGGRLTPKSVHKLLRLGYRSLRSRPNTTRLAIDPGDRLTVVGDLHGKHSSSSSSLHFNSFLYVCTFVCWKVFRWCSLFDLVYLFFFHQFYLLLLFFFMVCFSLTGQLPDLLHILEQAGMPSKTNKYLFNGDFVDRGAYGVEVMCTLLALHIAMPGARLF